VRRNEIGDEEGKGETQVAGSTANGKGWSNKEPMEAVEGMEMMKVTAMVFCKELGGGKKSGLMGLRQCGSKLHECLKRMST
jgi:hypothetical protein